MLLGSSAAAWQVRRPQQPRSAAVRFLKMPCLGTDETAPSSVDKVVRSLVHVDIISEWSVKRNTTTFITLTHMHDVCAFCPSDEAKVKAWQDIGSALFLFDLHTMYAAYTDYVHIRKAAHIDHVLTHNTYAAGERLGSANAGSEMEGGARKYKLNSYGLQHSRPTCCLCRLAHCPDCLRLSIWTHRCHTGCLLRRSFSRCWEAGASVSTQP